MSSDFGRIAIGTRNGGPVSVGFFECWTRFIVSGTHEGDEIMAPAVRKPAHLAANLLARAFLDGKCNTLLYVDDDHGTASKVSRVQDAAPFLGSGRVLLPDGAPWLAAWIDEHVGFPRAQHDEGPDTTAMAVKVLGRLVDMRGEDMESEVLFA